MSEIRQNYVDGEWTEAKTGETLEVVNPASRDEVVATYQRSSNADAEAAVEAATGGD